jgi:hypothetical protein
MEYGICGTTAEFHFGGPRDGFHLVFDAEALGKLLLLSAQALVQLPSHDAGDRSSSALAGLHG